MIKELDEAILDGKVGTKEYDALSERLEKLMKKCGGRVYPASSWTENVDTVIVVGIVALGIRSFFLQSVQDTYELYVPVVLRNDGGGLRARARTRPHCPSARQGSC